MSACWIGNGQVDLRQLVTRVDEVRTCLGQHNIVAVDGVVASRVAVASEGDGQTRTRGLFVSRGEGTGDSTNGSRVLFNRGRSNGDHRHVVNQIHSRLAFAIRVSACWIGNGQVNLRKLVASVDEISTCFGQHNVVAVDGVVTSVVAARSEGDGQTRTWSFLVSRGEGTGDSTNGSGVLFNRGRSNSDHRHVVNQRHIRRRRIVRAAFVGIGHGQINRRQFVASVDEVRTRQGQHHGIANEGVVAIFVAVAGEGDFQLGNRGFHVADGEVTGNGAFRYLAFHQGVGNHFDDGQVVDRNHVDRQRDRLGLRQRIAILCRGGHGQVDHAVGVCHRVVDQCGSAPVADVDALIAGRRSKGVARAVRNGRACRDAADFQLEGLGAVLVGGVGVNRRQLDRVVFQAGVQHLPTTQHADGRHRPRRLVRRQDADAHRAQGRPRAGPQHGPVANRHPAERIEQRG